MTQFLSLLIDRLEQDSSLTGMSLTRFCREILGVHPWKKQREIHEAIESGARRIFIKTGHGVGKSFDMACVVCWAMATWVPKPVVITTAPSFRQVKDILWREIRDKWNSNERLRRIGECNITSLSISEKSYAMGMSTNKPVRFQGIHAERLLIIIDEANGFPESIWQSIDSCLSNKQAILVAIGNAIVPYGRFFRGFSDPMVKTISVSSREHPNVRSGREVIPGAVTTTWIEDFTREYESCPQVIQARVDAVFPQSSDNALITRDLILRATTVEAKTLWPSVLAVDVARLGSNLTVVARQNGQKLESLSLWGQKRTTWTTEQIYRMYQEDPTDFVVVDDDGVGGGVTDQLIERGVPVVAFHNGGVPDNQEKFRNCASEAYWSVREGLEAETLAADTLDEDLVLQMTTRDYSVLPTSQILLEPKDKYTRRTGLPSPDKADAWSMAFWQVNRHWRSVA